MVFYPKTLILRRLCRKNGIVFIGPDPNDMERLGDKAILKELIQRNRAFRYSRDKSGDLCRSGEKGRLEQIGYPVMLKACAGGGGRGIRLDQKRPTRWRRRIFKRPPKRPAAFGDGSVYLEKYVFPARHVELQILGRRARQCRVSRVIGIVRCSETQPEAYRGDSLPCRITTNNGRRLYLIATEAVKKIGLCRRGNIGIST